VLQVNALDQDLLNALKLRYNELAEVDKVRGVILTAQPGIFSAGPPRLPSGIPEFVSCVI